MDVVEELRDAAKIQMKVYRRNVAKSYNKNVKAKVFKYGDWVMRYSFGKEATCKFSPNWEGPYRIVKVIGQGAYSLEDVEGRPIPRAWSIINLKEYYF